MSDYLILSPEKKQALGLENIPDEYLRLVYEDTGPVLYNLSEQGPAMIINPPIFGNYGNYGEDYKLKYGNTTYNENESTLNWDPHDWLGPTYTEERARQLKNNEPKLRELEIESKNAGTFMKLPNGSIYKGDPREYIMGLLAASKGYDFNGIHTGQFGEELEPFKQYVPGRVVWGTFSPNSAEYYAHFLGQDYSHLRYERDKEQIEGESYPIVYPDNSKMLVIPKTNETIDFWKELPYEPDEKTKTFIRNDSLPTDKRLVTDQLVDKAREWGYNRLQIPNVNDGPVATDGWMNLSEEIKQNFIQGFWKRPSSANSYIKPNQKIDEDI